MTQSHPYDAQIRALYSQFLDGWNRRSGAAVAAGFADDGDIIGFDGSHHRGRLSIAADLRQVFGSHQTPAYVGLVRSVRPMAEGVAVLMAHAGMHPAGRQRLRPDAERRAHAGGRRRGRPLADLALPVHPGGLAPAPRGARGADPGAARAARAPVSGAASRAADLLARRRAASCCSTCAGRSATTAAARTTWPATCRARCSSTSRPSWPIRRPPPTAGTRCRRYSDCSQRPGGGGSGHGDAVVAYDATGGLAAAAGLVAAALGRAAPTSGCWTAASPPGWRAGGGAGGAATSSRSRAT